MPRARSSPRNNSFQLHLLTFIIAVIAAPAVMAQGFGSQKLAVTYNPEIPPQLYIVDRGIWVEVHSNDLRPRLVERIQDGLRQWVTKVNTRLELRRGNPDTFVKLSISGLRDRSSWQTRTRQESRWVGSHTVVTDPETGAQQTVDDYAMVDVDYRVFAIDARWTVDYEVKNVPTGLVLAADRFEAVHTKDVEAQSTLISNDEAEAELERYTISRILTLLRREKSPTTAVLPIGALKPASELLRTGRRDAALQMLTSMPRFKKPADDAYRLYLISLCHELEAYARPNPADALPELEKALHHSRDATKLKLGEALFWIAKNRIEDVIRKYRHAVNQIAAFEESKRRLNELAGAPEPVRTAAAETLFRETMQPRGQAPEPNLVTNDTVIEWIKGGLPEDYIVASIKHAPDARFDLSRLGQQDMKASGASDRVVGAMRKYRDRGRPSMSRALRIATLTSSLLWLIPLVIR